MKRKRIRRVPKYKYNIYGHAQIGGDFVEIDEFICANNPNQALLSLSKRLKREGKEKREEWEERAVFLGNCDIDCIETLSPDKVDRILPYKKRKRGEQLPLFISYYTSQHNAP